MYAAAAAQPTGDEMVRKPAETTPLLQRQQAIRDRMRRLENRMLQLSQRLSENEPEKAERLRDALELVGKRQIKTRLRELARLIERDQLGEADRRQELLLNDLDALLTLLTCSLNEIERRRAERLRLEEMKRSISALFDEQMKLLQRTRLAASEDAGDDADPSSRLERLQRETLRRAEDLQREMKEDDKPGESSPGSRPVEQASGRMGQAARSLGDEDLKAADAEQQAALDHLQQALDALEDALRQVRREESEETLDALETRVRSMLTREKQVLAAVESLDEKGYANWTRVDELRLGKAEKTHVDVVGDCEATLRILVDEGTTVIVPELIRQAAADMQAVSDLLARDNVAAQTQDLLSGIVAVLEELLAAIERKREQDTDAGAGGQSGGGGPQPLLPGSAELKLLRGSQLRINERTLAAARAEESEADGAARVLQELAERQRRLAELSRRMNERD